MFSISGTFRRKVSSAIAVFLKGIDLETVGYNCIER